MSLRVITAIPQLVLFEVQTRVCLSFDIVKRYFGYSSHDHEEEMGKFKMDTKNNIQKFMIVGLGNFPHPDTRHSVGMRALDDFTERLGLSWENVHGRKGGLLCKTNLYGNDEIKNDEQFIQQIFLFKPKSLMNICGGNVARTAKSLGVKADCIYLIQDELDMAVGKVSIKNGGSANGHRGVLSCVSDLKSYGLWPRDSDTDGIILPRLRIGIGRPNSRSEVIPYVLDIIPEHEMEATQSAIDRGMELLMQHIADRVRKQQSDAKKKSADTDSGNSENT